MNHKLLFIPFLLLNTLFLSNWNNSKDSNIYINIIEYGAKGDGLTDDWEVIQRAVDEVATAGGGTIYFPEGEYTIYDNSIVIWGQNITIIGDGGGKSKIIKKGKVGWFGDCLDISGKIKNYKYFGDFGNGDYKQLKTYNGNTEKAKNIHLKSLTISSDLSKTENTVEKYSAANVLGIINSDQINLDDCIIENAPQTNVSIVNDTNLFSNGLIKFNNCVFRNSYQHNVRVISYNQGDQIGNVVEFDSCKFLDVISEDSMAKELIGKRVLLWYRGSLNSGATSVKVNNCFFDKTGIIYLNGNVNNFFIVNSRIQSSLHIQHVVRHDESPLIRIENSTIQNKGKVSRDYTNDRLRENSEKSLKNGFRKVDFGTVFPGSLIIDKK